MPMAFTRAVSPRLADCALTHLKRQPIDVRRAAEQQAAYELALADAGLTIHRLSPLDDHPDGVFVEDTAILLGDHAVITRPGIPSRFDEIFSTAEGLAPYFTIHFLESGILDGGDVLRIDQTLYLGRSRRTDSQGMCALRAIVETLGFQVVPVELGRCLHLKTAVTFAGPDQHGRPTVLVNPEWVDPAIFAGTDAINVDEDEPYAANIVRAADRLVMAAGSPRTAEQVRERGFEVVELDLSELQKAEAGGTCMSLIAD
ncbi:N(G),N(G)-dimethylarginine dimethylaminohydrolase [Sphingomonas sp. G124]|uniref:N(G),N(G)-dimethylarginine dimethylaminohydrolase n=1 Tax=Sphingomonas cremea TaxID=2904799 RepID=A0A9X1QN70_9SPHN|nr:N(G),N(G)-dimethylarginine dimethylaminohydrolase [Sphingomonas cremea]MCF2514414.1 N(G),N(G)-dimethylarginine dimethylaminohydrolase [Sphingomonas cremea]